MSRNLNEKAPAKQAAIFAGLIGRMKNGRRRGGRRHLDGRPLLHQRAAADLAAAAGPRHPRRRCGDQAVGPQEDRRAGHAHRDGDEALWRRLLGRADRARRRDVRPGRRHLFGDGEHRQGHRRAARGLLRRRPLALPRARRRGDHAGRHRPVPGLRRPGTALPAGRLRRHPCRRDLREVVRHVRAPRPFGWGRICSTCCSRAAPCRRPPRRHRSGRRRPRRRRCAAR